MAIDLAVYESFNGGDVAFRGRDLDTTSGLFGMVYMALFGAYEEDLPDDQNADWPGNALFFPEDETRQFNSRFEKALDNVALNSSGLRTLEQIAKQDLGFMSGLGDITVSISMIEHEKLKIEILLKEAEGITNRIFTMIWDATKKEEITVL